MQPKKQQTDNINYILNSPLGKALFQGFAQLYKVKPQFPVTYLGQWLKNHSGARNQQQLLLQSRQKKTSQYNAMIERVNNEQKAKQAQNQNRVKTAQNVQKEFLSKVSNEEYLSDLLQFWLPQYIEKNFSLTGCYVGELTFPKKAIQLHNFQPGAQNDTQSPKIIDYIGSSASHKQLMIGKILPNDCGKSYQAFVVPQQQQGQPQELAQGEQPKPKPKKRTYIYIPNVLNEQKIYYFKYPRLGAYCCYPLKIKSNLLESAFDKGVVDYKEYLLTKQSTQKEYNEKLTELKVQMEDAQKKFQEFEVTQQESSIAEKNELDQIYTKAKEAYDQEVQNPPKVAQTVFEFQEKSFIIGCDTLGLDKTIQERDRNSIEDKIDYLKNKWQSKQKAMLLHDIKAFIQDEPNLQTLQNLFRDTEKTVIANSQSNIKQHYANSEKQGQFQVSCSKCQKLVQLFSEQAFQKSMKIYLQYYVPKYTQILQIGLMLLGYSKQQINIPKTNKLNWRKVRKTQFIAKFLEDLEKYQIRRDGSQDVAPQYKINRIIQRIDKIDLQAVCKYNGWIWALANVIRSLAWARIQCRDARLEAHQKKLKAKQEREAAILKYDEDLSKALETHKAELGEQGLQNFKEQQWIQNYKNQNAKPQPLIVEQFQPHLDIGDEPVAS